MSAETYRRPTPPRQPPTLHGTPVYFDHPFLGARACRALLDRGVLTYCLDTQNIDETPDGQHPGLGFPVHLLVAEAGGIIIENLAGIEQIDFDFPLRLTGADGSPTRAVAIEFGS